MFSYDQTLQQSKCAICEFAVPGTHLGNLRNHLKRKHPDVLESIDVSTTDTIEPPRKKAKITVEYDKEELLEAWIDLVTVDGRPFLLLDPKHYEKS